MIFRPTLVPSYLTNVFATLFLAFTISGCASVGDIVPQFPAPESANSTPAVGQDIAQANAFLDAGQIHEAAAAYFSASQNYRSPERERLILQAAELASLLNDVNLTQRYLAPLSFNDLNVENQSRFRLVQAQLALNDRNYRETLRILPQRVNNLPAELGKKILNTRLTAAQSSGDKLALVQELVLQESSLTEAHQVSLNHDRIWGQAQQIPAFQLDQAKNNLGHPIVKNWLSLAQLSRISKNGPVSKRQTLRGDLGRWIQNNPNHPGMTKALGLLNATPTTTVTPYNAATPVPVVRNTVAKRPVVKSAVTTRPAPVVIKQPIKADPNVKSLYENIKKEINKN